MREKRLFVGMGMLVMVMSLLSIGALAVPTLISYQGKLNNDTTGNPFTLVSLRINITELNNLSAVLWNNTYDNITDQFGVFSIILGKNKTLNLTPGKSYQLVAEVDLNSAEFTGADIIYGNLNPAGDDIRITASGPSDATELFLSDNTTTVQAEFTNYVKRTGGNYTGNLSIGSKINLSTSGDINLSGFIHCSRITGSQDNFCSDDDTGAAVGSVNTDKYFLLTGTMATMNLTTARIINLSDTFLKTLNVSGNVNISSNLVVQGDTQLVTLAVNQNATINNLNVSKSFQVDTNTLYVDDITNRVGIGVINNNNTNVTLQVRGNVSLNDTLIVHELGRVGINTYTPTTALDVLGTINASLITVNNVRVCLANGTNCPGGGTGGIQNNSDAKLASVNISGSLDVKGQANIENLNISGITVAGKNVNMYNGSVDQNWSVSNNLIVDSQTLYVDAGNDKVGIGTTLPASLLHINGTGPLLNISNASNSLLFVNSTGLVGIGTSSPVAKFEINTPNAFPGTIIVSSSIVATGNNFAVITTDAQSTDIGGMVALGGMRDDAAVNPGIFGGLRGGKENAVTGNTAGYLGFYTLNAGISFGERMRISSTGKVGIGTTVPKQALVVQGDVNISGNLNVSNNVFVSSTNVGIGTTTPTTALDVLGRINATRITIESQDVCLKNGSNCPGGGTGGIQNNSDAQLISLAVTQNVTINRLNVTNDSIFLGKIGIGTAIPLWPLDIRANRNATVSSQATVGYSTVAANNTHLIMGVNKGFADWQRISKYVFQTEALGTNSDLKLHLRAFEAVGTYGQDYDLENGTFTDIMTFRRANVGIGTTSPTTALDVLGRINATRITIESQDVCLKNGSNCPGGGTGGIQNNSDAKLRSLNMSGLTTNNVTLWNGSLYQSVYASDDGLVLYWSLSENTGTVAFDQSGNGYDGALSNGPVWVAGKFGYALGFDGVNDRVSISNFDIHGASFNWSTITVWFKKNATDQDQSLVWSADNGGFDKSLEIDRTALNQICAFTGSAQNCATYPTNDNWVYVAVVYRNGSLVDLYADGIQLSDSVATSFGASAGSFAVGAQPSGGEPFNGTVDEVMIYNRSLGVDEIRTQYLRGLQSHNTVMANTFRIINSNANVNFLIDRNGNVNVIGTLNATNVNVSGTINAYNITNYNARIINLNTTASGGIQNNTDANLTNLNVEQNVTVKRINVSIAAVFGNMSNNGSTGAANEAFGVVHIGSSASTNVLTLSVNNISADLGTNGSLITFMQPWWSVNQLQVIRVAGIQSFKDNIGNAFGGGLMFLTQPAANIPLQPVMTLKAAGTVGINDTTPDFRFEVDGSFGVTSSTDGDTLYANERKVGIGTTGPAQSLTVQGNVNISGNLNVSGDLYVNSTNAGIGTPNSGLQLRGSGFGRQFKIEATDDDPTINLNSTKREWLIQQVGSGDTRFRIFDNSASKEVFTIQNVTGNIGIGTTSPAQTLTVQGSANFSGSVNITGNLNVSGNMNLSKALSVGGNVGIGTTAPSGYGNGGTFRLIEILNNGTGANAQGLLMLSTGATSNLGSIGGVQWVVPNSAGSEKRAGIIGMSIDSDSSTTVSGFMAIWTNNAGSISEKMRITPAGNIGIGTTSPSQTLTVQGNVNMSGNLNVSGTQPATISTSPGDAAAPSNIVSGRGGDTDIGSTSTGGIGGNVLIAAGNGGNATGTATFSTYTGGAGGTITLIAGAGGNQSFGSGAAPGANTGGGGGDIIIGAGLGGNASGNISGSNTGGSGGNVYIYGGRGAASVTTKGANGSVLLGISSDGQISNVGVALITTTHLFSVANQTNMSSTGEVNISNDLLVDSGTLYVDSANNRVGISTTDPAQSLTVQGNVNISGNLNVSNLLFVNGSAVGIGTAKPAYAFQVDYAVGEILFNKSRASLSLFLQGTDNGTNAIIYNNATGGSLWQLGVIGTKVNSNLSGNFRIFDYQSSKNVFIIQNGTGNVGIGISGALSPTSKLVVNDNSTLTSVIGVNITLLQNDGVQTVENVTGLKIYTEAAGNTAAGSDVMGIRVNAVNTDANAKVTGIYASASGGNTNYAAIFNGGNVGIGTITPNAQLEVQSSTGGSITLSNSVAGVLSGTVLGNLTMKTYDSTAGAGTSGITAASIVGVASGTHDATNLFTDLVFSTSHDTDTPNVERMRIDASGNVGIGTTAPKQALVVQGDVNISGNLNVSNTLFVSSANVGIGTAAPVAPLHIAGQNKNVILIENAAAGNYLHGIYTQYSSTVAANNKLIFNISGVTATTGTQVMTINGAGNVGIGTTDPAQTLTVQGSVNISSILNVTTLSISNTTNRGMSTCTMLRGNCTISNNRVTANTKFICSTQKPGGALGITYVGYVNVTNGNYNVSSSNALDSSEVACLTIEPNNNR